MEVITDSGDEFDEHLTVVAEDIKVNTTCIAKSEQYSVKQLSVRIFSCEGKTIVILSNRLGNYPVNTSLIYYTNMCLLTKQSCAIHGMLISSIIA